MHRVASFLSPCPSQKLVKARISTLAPARLVHIVQVKILLFAESTPPPEGKIVAGQGRLLIPPLHCLVGVGLVLEGDKAVVAAALPEVQTDVDNGAERLKVLS